ncbi:hypothetical protein I4F81_007572 [Pyropia yezoensis]|uniref:Uncharacterized protein n=1 Tax=Pyropia yezoensis TaxID=2788 RepID=A0ACC3C4E7_PYRYE|nr:hypothetical protein I4F81_007572 [Neopyropia yezoensis]
MPAALRMRLRAVLVAPGTATVEASAVRAALTALALQVVPMRVVEAALTADVLVAAAVQSAAIPVAMVEAVIYMPVALPMVWVIMSVGPTVVSMVAVVSAPGRHMRVVTSLPGGVRRRRRWRWCSCQVAGGFAGDHDDYDADGGYHHDVALGARPIPRADLEPAMGFRPCVKSVANTPFLICTACRKYLSSRAPMEQHLAGQPHKNRMALMRYQEAAPPAHLREMNFERLWCSACNSAVDSPVVMLRHCTGRAHEQSLLLLQWTNDKASLMNRAATVRRAQDEFTRDGGDMLEFIGLRDMHVVHSAAAAAPAEPASPVPSPAELPGTHVSAVPAAPPVARSTAAPARPHAARADTAVSMQLVCDVVGEAVVVVVTVEAADHRRLVL